MNRSIVSGLIVSLLLTPAAAFASTFQEGVIIGRTVTAKATQQQLDSLNAGVFSDAFMTAKIIGYDRSEIDQMKADIQQLKQENAQLRAQLTQGTGTPTPFAPSLEGRVAKLEASFSSLQGTLSLIVTMLTALI